MRPLGRPPHLHRRHLQDACLLDHRAGVAEYAARPHQEAQHLVVTDRIHEVQVRRKHQAEVAQPLLGAIAGREVHGVGGFSDERQDGLQRARVLDIFPPVARHQVVLPTFDPPLGEEGVGHHRFVATQSGEVVVLEDVDDRIANDDDVGRIEPLPNPMRFVLVAVGVNDVGEMVDRGAVLLFGHAPVVRAHAPLDVHDRQVELGGSDRPEGRVRVPEEHRRGRVEVAQRGVESRDDRRDDVGVGLPPRREVDFCRNHLQLPEEDVLEVVRVVLARPNEVQRAVRVAPQLLDDEGGPDDVGPDAQDERQAVIHGRPARRVLPRRGSRKRRARRSSRPRTAGRGTRRLPRDAD